MEVVPQLDTSCIYLPEIVTSLQKDYEDSIIIQAVYLAY